VELRPQDIQEILKVFAESELEELRLEIGATRLHVSKKQSASPERSLFPAIDSASQAAAPAPPQQAAQADPVPEPPPGPDARRPPETLAADGRIHELRSPLLGVFYRRPAPDQPAFVELGSQVSAADSVCIIDVMKMFTSVPAGMDGRIIEICAEDGQLVEFDQVLMRIEEG
jgi:acetyl-CoA carboxylase biotin carboxyl carrier protein